MKRREFLKCTASALTATGLQAGILHAATDSGLDRIAVTTVSLRLRFPATRPQRGLSAREPNLELLDVPALLAEKLGLHNVEVWSKHFTEPTVACAKKLRVAAEKVGSRIVNVQMDEPPFDLSSPDREKRKTCIKRTKKWMEIAAAAGAPFMRANTGGKPNEAFDLDTTADSYEQLATHGEKIGVKTLIENHGGHSAKATNVASIAEAVNSPWCRTLPDFGNMPRDFTTEQRVAFLDQILPYAAFISAKGMEFDEGYNHTTYDFAACIQAAEKSGYKGIYSIELWASNYVPPDPFRAIRTLISVIQENVQTS